MLSIIIPTHNRPKYLKRILSYYSDYQIAYNIIVADSSSDEVKKVNEKTISLFTNKSISHLSNYPSTIEPLYKIADAVNHVNTEYCVFCADDDFITPNGINQSVDFLEKNPDFTVAHGYYIYFCLKIGEEGKEQFYSTPPYPHESILFPDAEARLNYHLSNYQPTFYGVHRTSLLKMVFKEALKFTRDYRFGELLPSMLTLIYGKMKCLDVLYAGRDQDSIRCGYYPTLGDAIKAGIYNREYAKFRDCLSAHLSKQAQLDIEDSKKVVDKAMSAYMKKCGYNYKQFLLYKAEDVLDHLPDRMDKGIRALYRKLFPPRHVPDFYMEISPSSEYYNDLNKICLHVLSHQKQIIREIMHR